MGILSELLIRTDNENERDKWVATLDELQKAARQLATKKVYWFKTGCYSPCFVLRSFEHINCVEIQPRPIDKLKQHKTFKLYSKKCQKLRFPVHYAKMQICYTYMYMYTCIINA